MNKKLNNKKEFLIAIAICFVVGLLGAFIVTRDSAAYVASMTIGISIIFCLPLLILILFVCAIVAAFQDKAKYTLIFLMCCVLFPISYLGSIKLMEFTGIAKYSQVNNEMTQIGSELNERIVIAFKETASQEEINKFDETILRKTVPQPNGTLLDFADGVCHIAYPNTEFKYKIADVGFCNNATVEQKKKIRDKVNSSKIIYKVFENLQMEDVKNLPLEKKKVAKETQENKKELKTVEPTK